MCVHPCTCRISFLQCSNLPVLLTSFFTLICSPLRQTCHFIFTSPKLQIYNLTALDIYGLLWVQHQITFTESIIVLSSSKELLGDFLIFSPDEKVLDFILACYLHFLMIFLQHLPILVSILPNCLPRWILNLAFCFFAIKESVYLHSFLLPSIWLVSSLPDTKPFKITVPF